MRLSVKCKFDSLERNWTRFYFTVVVAVKFFIRDDAPVRQIAIPFFDLNLFFFESSRHIRLECGVPFFLRSDPSFVLSSLRSGN